jgi:RND family efflux transporter MFP subunit
MRPTRADERLPNSNPPLVGNFGTVCLVRVGVNAVIPRLYILLGLLGPTIIGCTQSELPPKPGSVASASSAEPNLQSLEVTGRTQCAPGRRGLIAPVPLHPVVEVMVAAGDRVKKGQTLVKIDDDEPQADLRAKEAGLTSARHSLAEAQRFLAAIAKLHEQGGTAEQTYHAARVAMLKAEQDERAATAAVESAKAELEHYTVTAALDGVIAWLDVCPGMVSRPGTSVWGEILDLSEIDVRCDVLPAQADRITAGQAAQVQMSPKGDFENAKVISVGIAADKATDRVPVVVRMSNAKARLRCGIETTVRFTVSP